MRREKLGLKIMQSFWFMPAVYIIVSTVIGTIAVNIDFYIAGDKLKDIIPEVMILDGKLVVKLLSTLITATLTMTTITFSTIMVVLTTFSGQFSPRTLQNFIADRKVQNILGIFVGSFVYYLTSFLQLRSVGKENLFITPILTGLTAIIGVSAFVYLINHVAKWVQVNNLIDRLTREAKKTIHRLNHEIKQNQEDNRQYRSVSFDIQKARESVVTANSAGYVDLINMHALINHVEKDDIKVKMEIHFGDYIVTGMKLLTYSENPQRPVTDISKYRNCIHLGSERTGVQDIELEIQKLVEIALKAISPAINDPHTAINCINRIGEIFIHLSKHKWLLPELYQTNAQKRLQIKQHSFSYYLYKAFYQIRHYSNEDVSVTIAILHVLKLVAEQVPDVFHDTIWDFAVYIMEGFKKEMLLSSDNEYLNNELIQIAEITGHQATDYIVKG